MNNAIFVLLISMVCLPSVFTQGITIGSALPPDPSSVLDIQSTQGGVLYPRMTETERNAILSPANGLMIFNTTSDCLQMFFTLSNSWTDIRCACQQVPSAQFTPLNSSSGLGASVSFFAQNTAAGLTYNWSFQGGTPSSASVSNPSVSWSQTGTYGIQLVVTDLFGCANSFTDSITIINCPSGSATFTYTGSQQTWIVPSCVTSISITANGAQGSSGAGAQGGVGGLGGSAQGQLTNLVGGETLYIYVGGQNGYNGGAIAGSGGGVGGGASDIRINGTSLSNRIIIAGGGGGGGGSGANDSGCGVNGGGNGGSGGGGTGSNGVPGSHNNAGFGGSLGTGGSRGNGCSCCLGVNGSSNGQGGSSYNYSSGCSCSSGCQAEAGGGGGGGGFQTGGGGGGGSLGTTGCSGNSTGGGGGGGGGSSSVSGLINGTTSNGVQTGNGSITITY
jgi:hypothetical protein